MGRVAPSTMHLTVRYVVQMPHRCAHSGGVGLHPEVIPIPTRGLRNRSEFQVDINS